MPVNAVNAPGRIFSPQMSDTSIRVITSPELPKTEREQIIARIETLWGKEAKTALEVFTCESNLNPLAISRTMDVGISQINLSAHWDKVLGVTKQEKITWLLDWEQNLNLAFELFKQYGWKIWVCY